MLLGQSINSKRMTRTLLSKNTVKWSFVIAAIFSVENSNPDLPLIMGPSSSSVKFKCKDSALRTVLYLIQNTYLPIITHLLIFSTFWTILDISALESGEETKSLLIRAVSTFSLQLSVKQQRTWAAQGPLFNDKQLRYEQHSWVHTRIVSKYMECVE